MTLESSKTLGGVGAILMLIGLIPFVPYTGILDLIGFIILLVGLHGISNFYKESGIFDNALYGFIAAVVGVVAAIIAVIYVIVDTTILKTLLLDIYPGWTYGDWAKLASLTPQTTNIPMGDVTPVIGALLAVLAILWIGLIISTFFDRRSLKMLSTKTNVGLFSTAGLLLFIGAFLTIILIGFVLIWIGILLMAIAFFQIKTQPSAPTAPPP